MRIEVEGEGNRLPKVGLILLQCLIIALFFLFVLRFWFLQIHKGSEFSRKSSENRLRSELIYASRGFLQDREGRLLAENRPAFSLALNREECPDIVAVLGQISQWTGIPFEKVEAKYNLDKARAKVFESIILIPDMSFELLARIEANLYLYPGLSILTRTRRHYPHGPLIAHILGYVAEASEKELEKDKNVSPGDIVGKSGLELMLEQRLRGQKGLAQVEVNALGNDLSRMQVQDPQSGESITLSLDLHLQQAAEQALGENAGCIVVMDPETGQILVLLTKPSYDNNAFASGLSVQAWAEIRDNPDYPLQNRVIQSTYPPGSVWKLAMVGLLLDQGVKPHESVFCSGRITLGTHDFRCWKKDGHGTVNMNRALIESCDVYFYLMGERMGIDKIEKYMKACGFGKRTEILLPNEKSGLVPSKRWKKERFNQPWHRGETLHVSIGQGFTLVTPVQIAQYLSALLNGGNIIKPELLKHNSMEVIGTIPSDEKQRAFIIEAMRQTVEAPTGTAKVLKRSDAVVGGKTGTAQVVKIVGEERLKAHQMAYKHRDHAWMASWVEKEGKKYVIVVMVEHGGGGSSTAGPIVKQIIKSILGPDPAVKVVPAKPDEEQENRQSQNYEE